MIAPWMGAAAPRDLSAQEQAMRPLNEIIVHCTATRPDWWATRTIAQKVAEVRRWHVEGNKWADIGYHYLIDRDGKVATGRPLERVGAHVQGRNTGTIGIALFGGHGSSALDEFSQHFTPAQDKALRELIADLRRQFPSIAHVSGHNQYSAKACPGFRVPKWYPQSAAQRPTAPPVAPPAVEVPAQPTGLWRAILALWRALTGDKA